MLAIVYMRQAGERYTKMHVRITSGKLSCARARTVMRRYRDDPRRCLNNGNTCVRDYCDAWTCQAPTYGSYPVIQSCAHGRMTVTGTVRASEAGGAE
jgi:hypothetical protein